MSIGDADNRGPLSNGVIFNAYPDSIGSKLADSVALLSRPELQDAFSLFYILPTFFNSDLDRGFSVIDYDINDELVNRKDLDELERLNIRLKFDLVLNHLSVGSPQFRDLLANGEQSDFSDFFIDWNQFWEGNGQMGDDGVVLPDQAHLDLLFLRKPGLPILKLRFPDGSEKPYWNTFYQEVSDPELRIEDLAEIERLSSESAAHCLSVINAAIRNGHDPATADLAVNADLEAAVLAVVMKKRRYLGQMDLNAHSEQVWDFYDETLGKLKAYGASLIRLDAFAYLHKQVGQVNFFNKPGTWDYLDRLKQLAGKHGLTLLPEIHSEYGSALHEEVAAKDFPVYDFFLPGLIIDALDRGNKRHLLRWINELQEKNIRTVNMLGCHDGIPVLDLRGKDVDGNYRTGLLSDGEIEAAIATVMERGGRVKNLFGPDGKKIAYYQINATYYSALGEDDQKMLLARAIQLFAPGIPQVWYLDLFAGKNDYAAADRGGTGGHKEINRTTLSLEDIEHGLSKPVVRDQLQLIRLRNTHPAFDGELEWAETGESVLSLSWRHPEGTATLVAGLADFSFSVTSSDAEGKETVRNFG
ncbi:MAG: glycosidase [Xanthomonadales bacterium]|nr:glycosidase [Xanthomonadales bacterium]NNK51543.1 glycosidase [Xanthomonadales bacterium]